MANFSQKDKNSGDAGGSDMGHQVKDIGSAVGGQVKNAGQKMGEAVKKVGDDAKSFASTATHKAEDAASYVGHKAQDATGAVASGMQSLGHTIRENTPREGVMGQAGIAVASHLESGGRYLEEHGLKGIGDDMTNMIKRNPIPAVLIGIGIGFLIAHATRS